MMKTAPVHVSRTEFDELFRSVKNWRRWGSDDNKGTLNYISPDHGWRDWCVQTDRCQWRFRSTRSQGLTIRMPPPTTWSEITIFTRT